MTPPPLKAARSSFLRGMFSEKMCLLRFTVPGSKVQRLGSATLQRVVEIGAHADFPGGRGKLLDEGVQQDIPLGAGQAPATALSGVGRVRSPTLEPLNREP